MSVKPVTVVMRSKNSAWVIGEALSGLFSQTYADFELLVIDSGSKDETLDLARQYPCRIMEIEAKSYFPGTVMNLAVENVDSEIVVVQNSDAIPQNPDALASLIRPLEDPKVAATFARQIPRHDALPWVRRDYSVSFPAEGPAPPWIRISFPFAAFRRSLWEKHAFYTDAFSSEDQEWAAWAMREGYRVVYVPESIVMHSHNYTFKELYSRRFGEGEAEAFIGGPSAVHGPRMALSVLTLSARDALHYLSEGNLWGLPMTPIRRSVEQYGFYRGFRHGVRRIRTGSKDASYGQSVLLSGHSEREPRKKSEGN